MNLIILYRYKVTVNLRISFLKSHKKVKHAGVASTLNDIRVTYWVCRGRQVVKRYLDKCVVCKINQGNTLMCSM